jgi:2-oxoglutarate ferredoxin oxidoreductase subunit gamma
LGKGGLLLYNSSLIEGEPERNDIKKVPVPATEMADSLGKELSPGTLGDMKDTRFVANSVMFGAYLGTPAGQSASKHLNETLQHFLAGKKTGLVELNRLAVQRGLDYMSSSIAMKR